MEMLLASLLTVLAMFMMACGTPHTAVVPKSPPVPKVVWMDDCASDSDCTFTATILADLEKRGRINLLAEIADSSNSYSAPVMGLVSKYYEVDVPVAAFQGQLQCSTLYWFCNNSSWAQALVARFNAGDTRAKYPDCVPTMRKILSEQSDVIFVESGYPTCLTQLLRTNPDLLRKNVKYLVMSAGNYPGGSEANMKSDPLDYMMLVSTWTEQNGFPPLYAMNIRDAYQNIEGPATDVKSPCYVATHISGYTTSPSYNEDGYMFASGLIPNIFHDEGNGTITVDSSGADAWTPVPSGQHWIRIDKSQQYVSLLNSLL